MLERERESECVENFLGFISFCASTKAQGSAGTHTRRIVALTHAACFSLVSDTKTRIAFV